MPNELSEKTLREMEAGRQVVARNHRKVQIYTWETEKRLVIAHVGLHEQGHAAAHPLIMVKVGPVLLKEPSYMFPSAEIFAKLCLLMDAGADKPKEPKS